MVQAYHLSVNNLSCRRGGRQVFCGLNFTVQSGEALVVTGANGAGKTSLLRQLAGLLPGDGIIRFSDGALLDTQFHFIGVKTGAKAHLTVLENLQFWRDMLGGTGDIARILQVYALQNFQHMPVQFLSSGQRQRLALSRLCVASRQLWLLDEPFSALDVESQSRLRDAITRHLQSGGMAIISTHGNPGIENAKILHLGEAA